LNLENGSNVGKISKNEFSTIKTIFTTQNKLINADDNIINVYEYNESKNEFVQINSFELPHYITGITSNNTTNTFACATSANIIYVFDMNTNKIIHTLETINSLNQDFEITYLNFNDNILIAAAPMEYMSVVFNLNTLSHTFLQKPKLKENRNNQIHIHKLLLAPCKTKIVGSWMLWTKQDYVSFTWDIGSGKIIKKFDKPFGGEFIFTPGGTQMVLPLTKEPGFEIINWM
jgi:WD40 repeat protein